MSIHVGWTWVKKSANDVILSLLNALARLEDAISRQNTLARKCSYEATWFWLRVSSMVLACFTTADWLVWETVLEEKTVLDSWKTTCFKAKTGFLWDKLLNSYPDKAPALALLQIACLKCGASPPIGNLRPFNTKDAKQEVAPCPFLPVWPANMRIQWR